MIENPLYALSIRNQMKIFQLKAQRMYFYLFDLIVYLIPVFRLINCGAYWPMTVSRDTPGCCLKKLYLLKHTHYYVRCVLIQIFIFLFCAIFTELSTAPDTKQSALMMFYYVSKKTVRLIQNEFWTFWDLKVTGFWFKRIFDFIYGMSTF